MLNRVVTRQPQCIRPRRTFGGAVGTLSREASCGHPPRAQDRHPRIRCGSRSERGKQTDRLCVWADRRRGKVLCEMSAPAWTRFAEQAAPAVRKRGVDHLRTVNREVVLHPHLPVERVRCRRPQVTVSCATEKTSH
eukprot:787835-Pleurochrysis_carterae.AAC.1